MRVNTHESVIIAIITINGIPISRMLCSLQSKGELLIGDIIPFTKQKYYNKGYGSLMMEELFKYALLNDIHKITGNLSAGGKEHKERQNAFYRKHGFEIIKYDTQDSGFYGEIIKNIVLSEIQ